MPLCRTWETSQSNLLICRCRMKASEKKGNKRHEIILGIIDVYVTLSNIFQVGYYLLSALIFQIFFSCYSISIHFLPSALFFLCFLSPCLKVFFSTPIGLFLVSLLTFITTKILMFTIRRHEREHVRVVLVSYFLKCSCYPSLC